MLVFQLLESCPTLTHRVHLVLDLAHLQGVGRHAKRPVAPVTMVLLGLFEPSIPVVVPRPHRLGLKATSLDVIIQSTMQVQVQLCWELLKQDARDLIDAPPLVHEEGVFDGLGVEVDAATEVTDRVLGGATATRVTAFGILLMHVAVTRATHCPITTAHACEGTVLYHIPACPIRRGFLLCRDSLTIDVEVAQETLLIELVGEQQGLWQAISVQAQTVKVLAYALINGQRGPNRRARSQTLSIDVKLIALIVGFFVLTQIGRASCRERV